MKTRIRAFVALCLTLGCVSAVKAETSKDVPATEAQKKSLYGLTSVKYRVVFDHSNSVAETVKKSFAAANVGMKEFSRDAEDGPLKASEGLVAVVVDNRDNNKSWVGLTVKQLCRLERSTEPTWTGITYAAGKVVARSTEKDAAKILCDEFVASFNKENPKK